MATSITACDLVAFKLGVELKSTAATANTADATEIFSFKSTGKPFIVIAEVAASNGAVTLKANKGELWAMKEIDIGSAPQGKTTAFYVEPAYGARNDGTVEFIAIPASGKKLLTDHTLKLSVIQL